MAAHNVKTYDGLVAFVSDHLELDSETAAQVPGFIALAEAEIDRLAIVPQRLTRATLTVASGNDYATLPSDVRSIENVEELRQLPINAASTTWNNASGTPVYYAIEGDRLRLIPAPADTMDVNILYIAKLPAIGPTNQDNWLLRENPDVYVYGALAQASAWLRDFEGAAGYKSAMLGAIDQVNKQGNEYRSGAPLVPDLGCVP